ncbi:hypothetical protein [Streptosporangium minutum]|nr:hypothetical protein [Streptosporangium minutum]
MNALITLGERGFHLAPSWAEITASVHATEMNTFDLDELLNA